MMDTSGFMLVLFNVYTGENEELVANRFTIATGLTLHAKLGRQLNMDVQVTTYACTQLQSVRNVSFAISSVTSQLDCPTLSAVPRSPLCGMWAGAAGRARPCPLVDFP